MKNSLKNVVFALALTGAVVAHAASPASGSCISKAKSLAASQKVVLVNEYDPDMQDFYDMGVCYYKVTLRKGTAYTIWINGGDTEDLSLSVDVNWALDTVPFAMFEYNDYASGDKAAFMYADSWDTDDPSSFTYYVQISGEIGATCNLYFQTGTRIFTQVGEEDNPKRITVSDSQVTDSTSLIGGGYYYITRLEAGRKYMFRTTGGAEGSPLAMTIDPFDYTQEEIPAYTNDLYNMSWYVYPSVTQDYVINISGVESAAFKLKYRSYPSRLPGEHESTKLKESENYEAKVVPGRMIGDQNYFDGVIDEALCRISLSAGENWVFETSGGAKSLRMVVYDANGNILRENTSMGNGSHDCRAAITTTYDGMYYVGVCRPDLEYWDEKPTDGEVTVFAYPADSAEPPDGYDPADDSYAGAEIVDTYPVESVAAVPDVGSASGVHALNSADWYDWFCFAGRKGTTYALKATFQSLETTDLTLNAKVYKLVNGSLAKISDVTGSISPESAQIDEKPLVFVADANAMYYVRVSVLEGVGLDFPEYQLHAVAYMEGTELGLVQVNTKGANTTWYFKDDASVLYPNGARVAVPANQTLKVLFTEASGYSTPGKTAATPVAWDGAESSIFVVTGVYNDTGDPGDDTEANAIDYQITPTAAVAKAKRTLWSEDDADWFRFRAESGCFYNFWLVDKTDGGVGDAVLSIKALNGTSNLVENVVECLKYTFDASKDKGKHNICVQHGTSGKADTAYWLYYQRVNAGNIRFATTTPKVSESADYVDVVVQRTASEGAVRVNFATEAYTAEPGKEYYPTNGVLEWVDGDMTDKVIRVRLIPDKVETWEEAKRFNVRLWPMADDALEADEYPALVESDLATVKINEISAKNPGSVIANVVNSKPFAGDTILLMLERVGGSDGRIAVQVKTQAGTAVAGRDYVHVKKNIVWEDGDTNAVPYEITTIESGAIEPRVFNVKLVPQNTGAYEGCETPSVPVNKVYFELNGNTAVATAAEAVAAAAESGISLDVKRGDWYVDSDGAFRCLPFEAGADAKLKFKVGASGFFIVRPSMVGEQGLFRYKVTTAAEDTPWIVCPDGADLVIPIDDPAGALIQFKLKNTDGATYASFARMDGGDVFTFIDLSSVVPTMPTNLEVLDVSSVTNLGWTAPSGLGDNGLFYRVRIGDVKAKSSKITEILCDGTSETSCGLSSYSLAPGKNYWWMLDYAVSTDENPDFETLDWVVGPSIWSFATAQEGAPATRIQAGEYDALGYPITAGETIHLVEGVSMRFYLEADEGDAVSCSLIDGELPPGVIVKSGKCKFQGVPVKAGEYSVLMQVITASGAAETLRLEFDVAQMGSASGSFSGVITESGSALDAGFPRVGFLKSLTVSESGAVSAEVKINGAKYKFAADSFDGIDEDDDNFYRTTLTSDSIIDGVTYANTLELKIRRGDPDDLETLGKVAGTARLTLNIAEDGIVKEVVYSGELVRDNSANADWLAAAARFAGYYTVSLVPFGVDPSDGVPCGNGYLTMTVDASGMAKYAGLLADGTAVSGSSKIALRGDIADVKSCAALVPVGLYSSPWSFGGTLRLVWAEDSDGNTAMIVDSRSSLEWNKDGAKSSYDGQGFRIELRPTGGWYNTLVNLQTYYLNRDFTVEAQAVDGIPSEMLPSGNTYTADTMPHGVNVTLGRSALTPDARSLVAAEEGSALYDLAASVNPWKVKTKFVPETGLVTGTFKAWSDGTTQSQFATLNHYGVLLMNHDGFSPLEGEVWTAGFYLLPVTSDWSMSLPFNIRAITVDRDWTELEPPLAE